MVDLALRRRKLAFFGLGGDLHDCVFCMERKKFIYCRAGYSNFEVAPGNGRTTLSGLFKGLAARSLIC